MPPLGSPHRLDGPSARTTPGHSTGSSRLSNNTSYKAAQTAQTVSMGVFSLQREARFISGIGSFSSLFSSFCIVLKKPPALAGGRLLRRTSFFHGQFSQSSLHISQPESDGPPKLDVRNRSRLHQVIDRAGRLSQKSSDLFFAKQPDVNIKIGLGFIGHNSSVFKGLYRPGRMSRSDTCPVHGQASRLPAFSLCGRRKPSRVPCISPLRGPNPLAKVQGCDALTF
jgi:hypothetical protein